MGKVKWGGVKIGDKRIYTLAYADDIVLLMEEEKGMRTMIGRLEEYLDRKRLELNAEKTKIMRFKRGGGRMKKKEWRWKEKRMEEVKEFSYLGYKLQRNGGQERQIKEKIRKTAVVMGQV